MSQTRNQKRFTISEVAADWHELMIPQRTMRPSIARISEQSDPRFAANTSRHSKVAYGSKIAHFSGNRRIRMYKISFLHESFRCCRFLTFYWAYPFQRKGYACA